MAFAAIRNGLNQGFPPKPVFTERDVPPGSQAGRVFMVTGGNSGIGFEICRILYASGARVYMAARSEIKCKEAIEKITKSVATESSWSESNSLGTLKHLHLDLADLNSVKAAATTFAQQEAKLDVLWNNAGLGANRVSADEKSAQGIPISMAVHCVATLQFTLLLLPQLQAAAAAQGGGGGRTRVLWTSSGTADYAVANGIDLDKLDSGLGGQLANYCSSKAATRMLGVEFARRFSAETGVASVVVDPGNVKSHAWDNAPLRFLFDLLWTHPTIYGACTELYAGLSPDFTLANSGIYVAPFGRIEPDEEAYRQDVIKAMKSVEEGGLGYGARLWEWCKSRMLIH